VDWLTQLPIEAFLLFTLVLARVSGLVMTAPIYGTSEVPLQVRALLAFGLALVITPTQLGHAAAYPGSLAQYAVFLASELAIGVILGLGIVILFSGIQLAGEAIGQLSGAMLADVLDPASGDSVPLFSHLLYLLAVAVFVCIGGHRMVMAGLLDTFRTIPPAQAALPDSLGWTLVTLIGQSFALGLRAAAPALVSLLLANLVLGLIGRTLPQLNILVLGFSINALLTFGVLILSLGAAVWVFQGQIEPFLETLLEAVHAPLRAR
jgi:flagellar biosynthetic protein FliR